MSAESLARLLSAGPLLMDFDGPICSVFAGYPAPRVAAELVTLLGEHAVEVPAAVREEPDPMEVLRWSGEQCSHKVVTAIEDALCEAELRAVAVAAPTPFGHELIVNAHARGLPVAIVSNNSAPAVEAYLAIHGLAKLVAPIVGRAYADPARMKPHPGPILDAVRSLGAAEASCTLVGDSLTDIEGARAAGVSVIGYANRPWKVDAFSAADVVVTSMQDLSDVFSAETT